VFCAAASGQSLRVYSEFARIAESGEVTAPAAPREILSPAIVRNGFTSFQVVVQAPKGTPYWLHIGQNPDNAVRVTMYRENREKLEKVEPPIAGSSTQIFWMDLWADRESPVRRIKVEPELNIGSEWLIYPMEVRVMEATVPESATAAASLRAVVCGAKSAEALSDIGRMHARNGQQDVALSTRAAPEALKRLAACDEAEPNDPEWYFRIRDYLFRMK